MPDLNLDHLILCYQCNKRITDGQTVLIESEPIPNRAYCSGICRLKTKRVEAREIYAGWRKIQYTPGLEATL